jgi:hypothetical protein
MNATSQTGRNRDALVGGAVLVVIGVILLVAQYVPDVGRFVPLIVGLGLLGLFLLRRDYGLLIGGGVVTGVGVGIWLASSITGTMAGAAFMLSLGGGFLGIWLISYVLRLAQRHWWPLVPGLILTAVGGAIAIGGVALDLISLWPVVLIVIGVLLLGSWFMGSRRAPEA